MNLLVIDKKNWINDTTIRVEGRQYKHMLEVHKVELGDSIRVGELNGKIGEGILVRMDEESADIEVELNREPPNKLPIKLILAMPRPKAMKRLIEDCTTLGIGEIHLIKTWKVEKSYWSTPWLSDEKLKEQMLLGLEQGCDTILPKVSIHKYFKPFVEDELPSIIEGTEAIVAHPRIDNKNSLSDFEEKAITIAIGPEGGFTDYEIDCLEKIGFKAVNLGNRILRVETAIKVAIGRLYY
ncbi:MAG: 16S rRNA (uracil(1498)-N(3))-methyltransferase [Tissierellales bacterium]|jgi:RsmE family RNA methyltransferase|nr:16S rRNA (uracil(1498)-N(3))-methyltransferase [Tissierellales bacterium]